MLFRSNIYDIIYHEKLVISKLAIEELSHLLDPKREHGDADVKAEEVTTVEVVVEEKPKAKKEAKPKAEKAEKAEVAKTKAKEKAKKEVKAKETPAVEETVKEETSPAVEEKQEEAAE